MKSTAWEKAARKVRLLSGTGTAYGCKKDAFCYRQKKGTAYKGVRMKTDFQLGIIGAGFAGLIAALRLKKSGKNSFVVFERADEVGGTWRENIYPGCACDIASPLYSIAGEPNPEWNRLYSGQPEIFDYLKRIVAKHTLGEHIRFNFDVVEAVFMEEGGYWRVTDRQGDSVHVKILIVGMGPLNRPNIPRFPGLEEYKGTYFHSARWDSTFDPKGKKVAVIGTGASAIQIIPAIAPAVAQLTVLQRTPPWVSHRFDKEVSNFSKALFRRFPFSQKLQREFFYWLNEFFGLGFIGNKRMNRLMGWISSRKLKNEVKDPAIREKLRPGYTIGCKRILRSDDFYPTFNRENVRLLTENIELFTARGIRTSDGEEHLLDAVIFATGFVAADINVYTRVLGRNGRSLIQEWEETGAEAYLGTTVSGYPNLAFILGPNTGLGHNSVVHMMESQMNYIMQYIEYLEESGEGSFLEVKEQVQQAYNSELQAQFTGTVWTSGCQSWYTNAKGRNTTLYPRLTRHFRKKTKVFKPDDYQLIQQRASRQSKEPVGL